MRYYKLKIVLFIIMTVLVTAGLSFGITWLFMEVIDTGPVPGEVPAILVNALFGFFAGWLAGSVLWKITENRIKPFESDVRWLKKALPGKYAKDIQDWWCWKELGEYYRENNIPDRVLEPIVQAIKNSGDANYCYLYCRYIKEREDMAHVIRDSGHGYTCYEYCLDIENREDMVQTIKDSGNPESCYKYCRYVENRPELKEIAEKEGYIL